MEEYHRFRREKKRFGVTSDGAFVVGISAPQGFGKTTMGRVFKVKRKMIRVCVSIAPRNAEAVRFTLLAFKW